MNFYYENDNGKEIFKVNGEEVGKEKFKEEYNNYFKNDEQDDDNMKHKIPSIPINFDSIHSIYNSIIDDFKHSLNKYDIKKVQDKDEDTQSNLDYYTKNTFNIFEVMHFLEKHPDWEANDENKVRYVIDSSGYLKINGIQQPIPITNDVLNLKFKLIPPKKDRQVSFMEAIEELHNNYKTIYCIYDNEKYVFDNYESMLVDKESGRAIDTDMIFNGKWYVKEDESTTHHLAP